MKNPKLIIKLNDNPIPNLCPVCDTETQANIGAELFLIDTDSIVCLDCAERHAPILAALIRFNDFSRLFHQCGEPVGKQTKTYFDLAKALRGAEKQFGERWEEKQNIKQSRLNSFVSFGVQASEVQNG